MYTYIYLHLHIHINIYIYICKCACACAHEQTYYIPLGNGLNESSPKVPLGDLYVCVHVCVEGTSMGCSKGFRYNSQKRK